jgi:3-oxoacyl-[acyl-carrier-protein] synthase-3
MHTPDIHLRSVGTTLPGPPIGNDRLARQFGTNAQWEQWVGSFIGTNTRHLTIDLDSGQQRQTLADLGATAGRRALSSAGLAGSDIDLMVLGTSTPDQLLPATVNLVADRLGVNEVPTYQLLSGCCGAVQAMDLACQLLRTGAYRTALVLGGEASAKHIDLNMDITKLSPAALVSLVLFGDGAGAAVLGVEPTPDSAVLRHVFTRLTGQDRAPGHTVEWFGLGDRNSDKPAATEDYKAIEALVPTMAEEILQEVLDALEWKESDLDFLLPPQLSGQMTRKIADRLGVSGAQEISCVRDTANTGNATPFLQLERVLPLMDPGDRAIGIAVESSKWIKSGFALEKV